MKKYKRSITKKKQQQQQQADNVFLYFMLCYFIRLFSNSINVFEAKFKIFSNSLISHLIYFLRIFFNHSLQNQICPIMH